MWPKSPGHICLSQSCCACIQVVIPQAQYWNQTCSMSLLMIHPKICSLGWIRCPTETHRAPGENTYQDLKSAKSQPVILESYKGKKKCQCSLSAGFRPLFKKSYYSFHRMCATAVSFSSPFKTNWNFDTWSPQILGVRRIEENPPGHLSCFP